MHVEVTNGQIRLNDTTLTIGEAKALASDLELAVLDALKQLDKADE